MLQVPLFNLSTVTATGGVSRFSYTRREPKTEPNQQLNQSTLAYYMFTSRSLQFKTSSKKTLKYISSKFNNSTAWEGLEKIDR